MEKSIENTEETENLKSHIKNIKKRKIFIPNTPFSLSRNTTNNEENFENILLNENRRPRRNRYLNSNNYENYKTKTEEGTPNFVNKANLLTINIPYEEQTVQEKVQSFISVNASKKNPLLKEKIEITNSKEFKILSNRGISEFKINTEYSEDNEEEESKLIKKKKLIKPEGVPKSKIKKILQSERYREILVYKEKIYTLKEFYELLKLRGKTQIIFDNVKFFINRGQINISIINMKFIM